MNKHQKWESSVIRKQMVETGYTYKKVKRLIIKGIVAACRKRPRTCSRCKYERPFLYKQNINYSTYCGALNLGDNLMYCIRKTNRRIKRLDKCPLR